MSVAPPTESPTGPAQDADREPRLRRRLVLAAVALVVGAALAVLGVVQTSADDGPAAARAGSPPSASPVASGAPSAAPSGEAAPGADPGAALPPVPADLNEPPPSLPPVGIDQAVPVRGVTASVTGIEAFTGSAVGPGNVSGPALRVTVRLVNGTDTALPLDGVAVALAHGPDQTPASPLDDVSQLPFTGTLRPGEEAEAVYVFSVPADAGDVLTVSVGHRPGAPIAVFTGAAG